MGFSRIFFKLFHVILHQQTALNAYLVILMLKSLRSIKIKNKKISVEYWFSCLYLVVETKPWRADDIFWPKQSAFTKFKLTVLESWSGWQSRSKMKKLLPKTIVNRCEKAQSLVSKIFANIVPSVKKCTLLILPVDFIRPPP